MRILFFLSFITLVSCSKKVYFTQDIYDDLNLSTEELKSIQFYLSDDIVLYRELRSEDVDIQSGKINVKDGSRREEFKFKKGTPGVFVFSPKENRFAISFDDGGDKDFLMFGPNKKASDRFTLLGSDWNRRVGTIQYRGKKYKTSTNSAFASLLVNLNRAQRKQTKSDSASGRRIN